MKKLFLAFAILLVAFNSRAQSLPDEVSVSGYGFLVFPTVENLETYISSFKGKTHAEVQAYLTDKGFSSFGATTYGEDYSNQTVSEEQTIDYLFDVNKIFQVQGVIIKPIGETDCTTLKWQYMLTMVPDNLTSSSHENLASGTYDASTKKKFATNPSTQSTPLVDFIKTTPFGHEETVANACATVDEEQTRRFLGWGFGATPLCTQNGTYTNIETGVTHPTYLKCDRGAYYIFWVEVQAPECHVAYSCR